MRHVYDCDCTNGTHAMPFKVIRDLYEMSSVEEKVNVVVLIVRVSDDKGKLVGHFLQKFQVHDLIFV